MLLKQAIFAKVMNNESGTNAVIKQVKQCSLSDPQLASS